MVKVQEPGGEEKLDAILNELCDRHGFKLYITGWSRKTYDVYLEKAARSEKMTHLARVESLVTTNGEIRFFDDRAREFVMELGDALERRLGVCEAVVIRDRAPGY